MVPDHPVSWDQENHLWRRVEHEVTLEAHDLAWLCQPVSIPFPGEIIREVAKMLGTTPWVVRQAMKRGQFSVRYVKGLGGVHANVAILYTRQLLNPAGLPLDQIDDPGWATMWRCVSEHIPEAFTQTIIRRPVYGPFKCGQQFLGWRWVCPGCGKLAKRIYCPIPGFLAHWVPREPSGSPDPLEPHAPCFACQKCHGVHDYGRLDSKGWNELVTYLSGGLLYGREVKRPSWYTPRRKRNACTKPAPSKRRAQLTRFLLDTDLSLPQIAARLGLARGTVRSYVDRVYKRNAVHCRKELRRALGTQQVQQAKAAG